MKQETPLKQLSDDSSIALGHRTIRGGSIVFGSMLSQKLGGLVILAVMARLLTPEDYGLLGMVFALVMFLQIFSDMGLPLATIQKSDLTHEQLSTIFWINLGLGCLLGIITVACTPLIVRFYQEPILRTVTLWCALGFPLAALGAQHRALLQRRMAFGKLSICEMSGLIAGGTVGVMMAMRGYSVFALIIQHLTGVAVMSLCYWIFTGWIPGKPVRKCGTYSMLAVGGNLTAFNILNYFSRNFDKILLGRFFGAAALGLYTRGCALMMFPVGLVSGPINSVTIPALSKIQDDPARMRKVYIQVLQLIGFISFPLIVWLLLCGRDVIALVYGARWLAVAPLFQILCMVSIWQGIYNATAQVYIAAGRTDRQLRIGMCMSLLLVLAFISGIPWGAKGVAIAYAVAFNLAILPYLAFTYKTINLRLRTVLLRLWPSLASALLMIPILWPARIYLMQPWTDGLRLLVSFLLGVSLYFIFSIMINRTFVMYLIRKVIENYPIRQRNKLRRESVV